jgi:SAM-dependent methyltransferase
VNDLPHLDPLNRFTGLAATYARYRPDYPPPVVDFILQRCGLGPGSRLVDVGCGTGISSRLFADRGLDVIGIEPNEEMRRQALSVPPPSGAIPPDYRAGQAEATGLPDATADAVLAAQAFHWFQPEPTLREFHRILKPEGWAVLVWNERDEVDPFTAAFGAVIRSSPGAPAIEGPRAKADQPLLHSPLFRDARRDVFRHHQELDEDGVLGRAFSASYAPREPAQAETFAAALREVFARFQKGGRVVLRYQTSVTSARKKEEG